MRGQGCALIVCGVVLQLAWAGTGAVQALALLGLAVVASGMAVWDD